LSVSLFIPQGELLLFVGDVHRSANTIHYRLCPILRDESEMVLSATE